MWDLYHPLNSCGAQVSCQFLSAPRQSHPCLRGPAQWLPPAPVSAPKTARHLVAPSTKEISIVLKNFAFCFLAGEEFTGALRRYAGCCGNLNCQSSFEITLKTNGGNEGRVFSDQFAEPEGPHNTRMH